MLFLFAISLLCSFVFLIRSKDSKNKSEARTLGAFARSLNKKSVRILSVIVLLSLFLNCYELNRPDVSGDQYGISFIAYDLVDGNTPGRDAYAISFKGHSPFIMYASHFSMNILDPSEYYNLEDWMTRFVAVIFGLLSTLTIFLIGREAFSDRVGFCRHWFSRPLVT